MLIAEQRAAAPLQKVNGLGEVPFRFNAVALEDKSGVIAVGRDLRAIAGLQQRMVNMQQDTEREIDRLRNADMRYRLLFHVSAEAVIVADATTQRVLEANPVAASLLREVPTALQGRALMDLFEPRSAASVRALIEAAEAGAQSNEGVAHLREVKESVALRLSLFRQSSSALLLLLQMSAPGSAQSPKASRTAAVLEALPDGFVVTGADGRILSANPAFCNLVQQANENQVIDRPLSRWLGRPGVDLNIMLANLRDHGAVRNFSTIIHSELGAEQEALVTAVSALDGNVPCLGFSIRAVSSKIRAMPVSNVMPRSVEQLRELVGRVSLKELVRESADLVEKLCIEAALDVSGNNRASAAQLLGLSRQGLYSKLHRHGLDEFDPAD